jgi:hypothetical protein
MLRGYRKNKQGRPVHDVYSHGADAFRTGACAFHLVGGLSSSRRGAGALRRRLRGVI